MRNADPERFDLCAALSAASAAYADAWPERNIRFDGTPDPAMLYASPELIMQMLDKLMDNAVGFSAPGDDIVLSLSHKGDVYQLSVFNPGPPLPEKMRSQLFDSMVSVRSGDGGKHLGLGLHIARIIAQGHGGTISADNVENGVQFVVDLPVEAHTKTG